MRCGAKGIWEAPYDEDWPSCELLPQHHCSVAQDLNNTIRQGFKLQAEAVTQVQTCAVELETKVIRRFPKISQ